MKKKMSFVIQRKPPLCRLCVPRFYMMLNDRRWSSPTIKVPRQTWKADPAAFPAAAAAAVVDPGHCSSSVTAWGRRTDRALPQAVGAAVDAVGPLLQRPLCDGETALPSGVKALADAGTATDPSGAMGWAAENVPSVVKTEAVIGRYASTAAAEKR